MQAQYAPSVRWEWISEAWNLFTRQWTVWVLMIFLVFLIVFMVEMVIYVPLAAMMVSMSTISVDGDFPAAPVFPFWLFLIYPVIFLAIISVMSWLLGGLYTTAFKQVRGEQISVGDLFSGGRYFVRILGAVLLISIAGYIGLILFVIPGLIVYGLAFLTIPMIVEGGKGTIDAIKGSIDVTKRDWIMFTLFSIALYIVAAAGLLACGVGALATMPLLFLGQALVYRDTVGMHGAAQRQDQFMPPPPPDYRSYSPSQTPQAQPWAAPTYATPPPQPPQSEPATNSCPHCGATLARTMNFCNQCGRPLQGA